jgi:hypothetical protein
VKHQEILTLLNAIAAPLLSSTNATESQEEVKSLSTTYRPQWQRKIAFQTNTKPNESASPQSFVLPSQLQNDEDQRNMFLARFEKLVNKRFKKDFSPY